MDMHTAVMQSHSPEEQELEKKGIELAGLQEQLAKRELELATLQAELRAFEQRYLRMVGVQYARLDEIEVQIAVLLSGQFPQDRAREEEAKKAHAKAQESFSATREALEPRHDALFTPSDGLKKLYRDIAKRIHPDLATDEKDRSQREKRMAEANAAYASCDLSRLQAILLEHEASPEVVCGNSVGDQLVRVIRKIAQVEHRLGAIKTSVGRLKKDDYYELMTKATQAKAEGRDLLQEMGSQLDRKIVQAQSRADSLRGMTSE